jgi:D-lactate dehydrogenase (cytochrome)
MSTIVVLSSSLLCYYFGTLKPPVSSTASTAPLAASSSPNHNIAPTNLQAAWADFVAIVGKENVSTAPDDLTTHSGSAWSTHPTATERPFLVVYPSSTAEVSAIMKTCHTRHIPVTAYSGGTSLEGHFAPLPSGGVCMDFRRMDKIVALHKTDLDVVVQPAVGWENLNEQLSEDGLFFPPDPGPGALIGGMIGTACSGTNTYRYGTMREWVLGMTVVLADGTVIKTRQRPRKSSAGYDLTKLFIGSEGTLGLVTEATLRLTPCPPSESVAVAPFKSVRQAAECVAAVVGAGVPVAAVEVLDDVQMHCINAAGMTTRPWAEAPTLFFKFAGTKGAVKEQISIVRELAKKHGCNGFEFAGSEEEGNQLWSARKEALWSVMAKGGGGENMRVWTTDVAVPVSRLPDMIEETKADIKKSEILGAIVGHVGDGNFHCKFYTVCDLLRGLGTEMFVSCSDPGLR